MDRKISKTVIPVPIITLTNLNNIKTCVLRLMRVQFLFLIISGILGTTCHHKPMADNSMDRVEQAKTQSDAYWNKIFQSKQLSFPPKKIYLRAFKAERQLEVWAGDSKSFLLIKTYPFTAFSGSLGPKQREGDGQIPEGFYEIDHFNPKSNFYLSMRVNYPNEADRIRNRDEKQIGGDIYIHGSSVSIGCIPLGDDNIRELYWLCWKFRQEEPKNIPVHIFPFRMTPKKIKEHAGAHSAFWKQLEPMYTSFESYHLPKEVSVDANGKYLLALDLDRVVKLRPDPYL
jgi:murein L,D-transpeptidase YafK